MAAVFRKYAVSLKEKFSGKSHVKQYKRERQFSLVYLKVVHLSESVKVMPYLECFAKMEFIK